jgi:rod shape-determining protein MreC
MANGTWKIARNRGSAQLPLIIVVALAVVLVLLGRAQSSLFDRARLNISDWAAPVLEKIHAPVQGFDRWVGSLGDILDVYGENLRLKDENARLRQWQNAAVTLDERIKRYQALLHAVPDPATESVLARVIGRSGRPFLETMILDAGKTSDVKPGEAVVDGRGIVGRIFMAGQRTSWVILLTDPNSRVPVTIVPGNVQAIMAGDNSAAPRLEAFSQNTILKPGAQIISSGDGGLVPQGLPVGTLVADGTGYRVALFAAAASSQDVEILNFKRPPETPPTLSAADLPAIAAGLAPAAPQDKVPTQAPPPVLQPKAPAPAAKAAPGAHAGNE